MQRIEQVLGKNKLFKAFILFGFYPIFYWLDRHVVPEAVIFWHWYVQDLVMPGYFLLTGGICLETLGISAKGRKIALLAYGLCMFIFGINMEIQQGPEGDPWDVLCYAISITAGLLLWFFFVDKDGE